MMKAVWITIGLAMNGIASMPNIPLTLCYPDTFDHYHIYMTTCTNTGILSRVSI
jgi:hypothetical protein